jgi:hypothetical protein
MRLTIVSKKAAKWQGGRWSLYYRRCVIANGRLENRRRPEFQLSKETPPRTSFGGA